MIVNPGEGSSEKNSRWERQSPTIILFRITLIRTITLYELQFSGHAPFILRAEAPATLWENPGSALVFYSTSSSIQFAPKWNLTLIAGKYCIYKGNDPCPKNLRSGWVFWEDSYDNDESDGTLPDGDYWKFTEIHFCCRTDGDKDVPIILPSNFPFFLLAYESAKCQMVKWAVASVEWIYYYTHNQEDDQRNGAYPYNAAKMHPTIYYCYYRGEKA